MSLIVLVALAFINSAQAAVPSNLPESQINTKNALATCNLVFVGKLMDLETKIPLSKSLDSGMVFVDAKIKVLQILRGPVASEISISIPVMRVNHEDEPVVGETYLFLVAKEKSSISKETSVRGDGGDEANQSVSDVLAEIERARNIKVNDVQTQNTLKLLPATANNIARVKELIRTIPPPSATPP